MAHNKHVAQPLKRVKADELTENELMLLGSRLFAELRREAAQKALVREAEEFAQGHIKNSARFSTTVVRARVAEAFIAGYLTRGLRNG